MRERRCVAVLSTFGDRKRGCAGPLPGLRLRCGRARLSRPIQVLYRVNQCVHVHLTHALFDTVVALLDLELRRGACLLAAWQGKARPFS